MQDEGVGIHAVRYIQEHYDTSDLEMIDGGTGTDILPYIENRDRLLVRAANFEKEPGFYRETAQ